VLIEKLIGLGIDGVRRRIPDDLVDSDLSRRSFARVHRIKQLQKKHRFGCDRARVDGRVQRNRKPRSQVETIQRIQDTNILTVGWSGRAVAQR
jgi:hypothetical protein